MAQDGGSGLQAAHSLPCDREGNQRRPKWGPKQGLLGPERKGSTGTIRCQQRCPLRSPESQGPFRPWVRGPWRSLLCPVCFLNLHALWSAAALCPIHAALGHLETNILHSHITLGWGKAASVPSWSPKLILCSGATLWGKEVGDTLRLAAWNIMQMFLFLSQCA